MYIGDDWQAESGKYWFQVGFYLEMQAWEIYSRLCTKRCTKFYGVDYTFRILLISTDNYCSMTKKKISSIACVGRFAKLIKEFWKDDYVQESPAKEKYTNSPY